jgi:hypothetical protein
VGWWAGGRGGRGGWGEVDTPLHTPLPSPLAPSHPLPLPPRPRGSGHGLRQRTVGRGGPQAEIAPFHVSPAGQANIQFSLRVHQIPQCSLLYPQTCSPQGTPLADSQLSDGPQCVYLGFRGPSLPGILCFDRDPSSRNTSICFYYPPLGVVFSSTRFLLCCDNKTLPRSAVRRREH